MTNRLVPLLILISFVSPSFAHADVDAQADQLLSYFSSGCQSQGEWSRTALNYSTGLIDTLRSISADKDCQSLGGALGNIDNLANAISNMDKNHNESALQQLNKQEQLYLQLMSQSSDPTTTAMLATYLQSVQSQISIAQPYVDQDKARPYQTFAANAKIILTQASKDPECFKKHSEVLTGLANVMGSFAAVTLTGGTSLLVATGLDLMNSMIEAGRVRRLNKKIAEFEFNKKSAAFLCTLETLSNQYCESRSSLEILHLVANSQATSNPFQKTANLLIHDLPLFLNWLSTVPAGAEPTNSAIAARQADVGEREKQVKNALQTVPGMINDHKPTFDALDATLKADERWGIELQIIAEIVTKFLGRENGMSNATTSSPFSDVLGGNASLIAPWLLIGVGPDHIPVDGIGNKKQLFEYSTLAQLGAAPDPHGGTVINPATFVPDLTFLRNNMSAWIDRADQRVSTERSIILNQDTMLIVSKAATVEKDNRSSPYRSLLTLYQFTADQLASQGATGSYRLLLQDTQDKLQTIVCKIHEVVGDAASKNQYFVYKQSFDRLEAAAIVSCPTPNASPDADAIIKMIYEAAKLDNGTGFLRGRLEWAIKNEMNQLNYRPQAGVTPAQAAILLAQNDYISDLQNYSTRSYQRIQDDILLAQGFLKRNLNGFGSAFSSSIAGVLTEFKAKGDTAQVAKLCSLLLAVPQWPSEIPKELCMGVEYKSVYDNETPITITEGNIASGFEDRVCQYYNFQQKATLHQELRDHSKEE